MTGTSRERGLSTLQGNSIVVNLDLVRSQKYRTLICIRPYFPFLPFSPFVPDLYLLQKYSYRFCCIAETLSF